MFKKSLFAFAYLGLFLTTALVRIPLQNEQGIQYVAQIELGTPLNPFNVIVDTGSSNLWVTSIDCETSSNCAGHNYYDPEDSSTYQNLNDPLIMQYGSGSSVCQMVEDDANFGGMDVEGVQFGICSQVAIANFANSGFDGILGLAFQSIANDNATPLLYSLYAENLTSDHSFSIYLKAELGNSGSQLILGGIDTDLNVTEFQYHNLISESYWTLSMSQASIDGEFLLEQSVPAIVDSGTSSITCQTQLFEIIVEVLGLESEYMDCSLVSSYADIEFQFDNEIYTLTAQEYFTDLGDGLCTLNIEPMDLEDEGIAIILGQPFMIKYYTQFDFEENRIGFATAI